MKRDDKRRPTIMWGEWQIRTGRPGASQPGPSFTGLIAGWVARHHRRIAAHLAP